MSYQGPTYVPYSPMGQPPSSSPLPVEMRFAKRERQRRWTVLLRVILVLPQAIVLCLVGVAAGVALLISWFAALVMGRLPSWAPAFLGGVVRWTARVQAYYYLLTDDYPPFSFELVPSYPVDVAIPPAGRLNRLAVLFRIILAVPASLVTSLVSAGMSFLLALGWLAALFTGWLPQPFFSATCAWLRFATRTYAYLYMLTPAYPGGLFGDSGPGPSFPGPSFPGPSFPGPVSPYPGSGGPALGSGWAAAPGTFASSPVQAAPGFAPPPGPLPAPAPAASAPSLQPASALLETPPTVAPGPPPLPGTGSIGFPGSAGLTPPPYYSAATAGPDPVPWRLRLTPGGRACLVIAIVLGVIYYVVYIALVTVGIAAVEPSIKVAQAYDTLSVRMEAFSSQASQCARAPDPLGCQRAANLTAAAAFERFDASMEQISFSSTSAPLAWHLEADANQISSDLRSLAAQTGSVQQYTQAVQGSSYKTDLQQFQSDYNALVLSL